MPITIDGKGNEYLLTFSKPETAWIRDLAKSMGITKEAIVGAAMTFGLVHYMRTFCPTDKPPTKEIDKDIYDDTS